MEYDEFNLICVENELHKLLLYLYKNMGSSKNKNDIKTLRNSFTEIDTLIDYESNFDKIVPNRNTWDYISILMWSK